MGCLFEKKENMYNTIEQSIKLANRLVNYSCKVQAGEKVLITYGDCPDTLIQAIIEEIFAVQAIPLLYRLDKKLKRLILTNSDKNAYEYYRAIAEPIMQSVDAVILISGSHNDFEFSDVPSDSLANYGKLYIEPVHFKARCSKKWVLLKYPTSAFAQSSQMSTDAFEQFFFQVCNLDYSKLSLAMDNLKTLMESTDIVRIVSPTTDLTFSIKGMPAIKCCGESNIPDGELFTAPIKDSVNGTITFNVPALDNGVQFSDIRLTFKDGKIIDFDCNDREKFQRILDTDEGSRYLGEFAFGLNPYCTDYVKDILFDEKMTSSIHLAVGSSYEECYNGNTSSVHLDLIQSHLDKYGGSKIYFDDALIYQNGKFIYPNLVALNSENLV